MRVLVTGAAGFIGSHLAARLVSRGDIVVGYDNHNDYYDPQIKEDRLKRNIRSERYTHVRGDLCDDRVLRRCFSDSEPDAVVNLAAQAGVRYSLENPRAYVDSNLVGFVNVLECSKFFNVKHLVYASSSSVYGGNTKTPFSINDKVDHPLSLYAATKKSNELMAHSYSHLFGLPSTGLRFFTVYGPWGRPDMALFKFTKCILEGRPITVFNHGNHKRDFTYIDDVVESIVRVLDQPPQPNSWGRDGEVGKVSTPWRIYNVGNGNPVNLMEYIRELENALDKKARIEFEAMQPGDVPDTFADVSELHADFDFRPQINVRTGIRNFVNWYREYFEC